MCMSYKLKVQRAFDKASSRYDEAAVLQKEVTQRMLERLDFIKIEPERVLDLGCGTGFALDDLLARYKKAQCYAVDLAPNMLKLARKRGRLLRRPKVICADAEALPFADSSFDLIFSSLMMQWVDDLDAFFAEVQRVLKPGGLFLFASFGPDTLKELRMSWAKVDDDAHVNMFMDMHDVGDAMIRMRYADPVMDVEHFVLTYNDVTALLRDLKYIGAHVVKDKTNKGLMSKQRFAALDEAYNEHKQGDKLPATYEIVYGHGWGSDQTPPQMPMDNGEVRISVDSIKRI